MGYIKRLADLRYRIKYEIPPEKGRTRQQKTETLVGFTKKEAEAILAERIAATRKQREMLKNGEQYKDVTPLSEVLDAFLEAKRTQKEANTIRRYEALTRLYLRPAFGDMNGKTLRPHHLTTAYTRWLRDGRDGFKISAKTVRHIHELMRNVLNWGVRKELLSRNVAALVSDDDLPKVIKPKPLALTEAEVQVLLKEAKTPTNRAKKRGYLSAQSWFYPAVAFAVYTGTRRAEVLALRWGDLNFESGSVTIARSITERLEFKPPKNDRSRAITMPQTLCAILKTHRANQAKERLFLGSAYKDGDLVFAKADGSPINTWNFGRVVRDCIARAKVTPITLHGLRDTHASLCAKAGVALEVVSKRLGHSNIGVTAERYLHVYSERDAEAAERFDRLVG